MKEVSNEKSGTGKCAACARNGNWVRLHALKLAAGRDFMIISKCIHLRRVKPDI